MDIEQLVNSMRARGGELPGVEVKSAAGGLPDSITETISAFANLPGGGLIVHGQITQNGGPGQRTTYQRKL